MAAEKKRSEREPGEQRERERERRRAGAGGSMRGRHAADAQPLTEEGEERGGRSKGSHGEASAPRGQEKLNTHNAADTEFPSDH